MAEAEQAAALRRLVGRRRPADPQASPLLGDLAGLPPTAGAVRHPRPAAAAGARAGARASARAGGGWTTSRSRACCTSTRCCRSPRPARLAPRAGVPLRWRRLWDRLRTPFWVARIVGLVGAVTRGQRRAARLPRPHPADQPSWCRTSSPRPRPPARPPLGLVLILLSRALRRGKRRAWLLATVLAALAALLHVLKGLDVEEAVLSLAVFVLLLASRRNFTAKPDPRSPRRLVAVVLGRHRGRHGPRLAVARDRRRRPGPRHHDGRAVRAGLPRPGRDQRPVRFVDQADGDHAAVALVVLGASVLLLAVLVALQPAGGPHGLDDADRERLRALLDRWGGDRLAVLLRAARRPVGDLLPERQVRDHLPRGRHRLARRRRPARRPGGLARRDRGVAGRGPLFGWVPAVLAASERGAEAFHRAGMDALELGDEAILHVSEFSLDGPQHARRAPGRLPLRPGRAHA